jgi:hypothetical protein
VEGRAAQHRIASKRRQSSEHPGPREEHPEIEPILCYVLVAASGRHDAGPRSRATACIPVGVPQLPAQHP